MKRRALKINPFAMVAFSEIYPVDLDKSEEVSGRKPRVSQAVIDERIYTLNGLFKAENRRNGSPYYEKGPATSF